MILSIEYKQVSMLHVSSPTLQGQVIKEKLDLLLKQILEI